MSLFFGKRVNAQSASDAKLTSFWNSLRHISPQQGILKFPVKYRYLVPQHIGGIYVRKAYEDLFELICKDLNPEDPQDRLHCFTITGTPGIGRGTFLSYVFWRLTNMESTKTVIVHRASDRGCIYVFQHDGCWVAWNYSDVDELLDNPTTWYLVDSYSDRPAEINAITIQMSPPTTQDDMYFRYSTTAHPYYLPVWSLEELKMAAPLFSENLQVVEERYHLIGGNPRYVFEKPIDLELIRRMATHLPKKNFFKFAFEAESDNDDIGHFIVHYLVDSTYSDYSLVFSSKYVASLVLKSLLALNFDRDHIPAFPGEKLKRVLLSRKISPKFSSLQANLLEYIAHRLLSAGGKFIGRSLDDGTTFDLDIPRRSVKMFNDSSECTDPDVYYMARSWNHPCIGSVVLNTGCFRMTMTKNDDIPEDEMKMITKELKVDKFYFVVPDRIFKKFTRQKPTDMLEYRETTQEQTAGGQFVEKQAEQGQTSVKCCLDTILNPGKNKKRKLRKTRNGKDQQRDFPRQYVICIPFEKDWKNICRVLKSNRDIFDETENCPSQ